jgi:hypothetical protein
MIGLYIEHNYLTELVGLNDDDFYVRFSLLEVIFSILSTFRLLVKSDLVGIAIEFFN